MSDLIERLRALDLNLTDLEGDDWRDAADAALLEAAQEIERLTNRTTMLRAEADGIGSLLLDVQRDCIAERQRARMAHAFGFWSYAGPANKAEEEELYRKEEESWQEFMEGSP